MDTTRFASTLVIATMVLVSLALAVFGAYFLTAETLGVGAIGGAVVVALIARINQAADQQAELRKLLERGRVA